MIALFGIVVFASAIAAIGGVTLFTLLPALPRIVALFRAEHERQTALAQARRPVRVLRHAHPILARA